MRWKMKKNSSFAFCPICLNKHEILQVEVQQEDVFQHQKITYHAQYDYCEIHEVQWANEKQLKNNSIRLKDAYRKSIGLLTSEEIKAIREKYKISQEALAVVLGWGKKTITRYETVSIQDKVHDDVLRKIDIDPLWFFDFVLRSKAEIDQKHMNKYLLSLKKYQREANLKFSEKSLYLEYYDIKINDQVGNIRLDPDRLTFVINYLATKVPDLSKNKAIKLLLFADFLHFCTYDQGITGLAYHFNQNTILPKGHEEIFHLERIHIKEIMENDYSKYVIEPDSGVKFDLLDITEINVLDSVIAKSQKSDIEELIAKIRVRTGPSKDNSVDLLSYRIACDLELNTR